jgi:hypothetical protein
MPTALVVDCAANRGLSPWDTSELFALKPLAIGRRPISLKSHTIKARLVGSPTRTMRYHIIEKEPCCASQQNWPAHVRFGSKGQATSKSGRQLPLLSAHGLVEMA